MHFQHQQHQSDCVKNIVSVLRQCDIPNNNFSNLSNAISHLWAEKKYTQFIESNKNRLDILMETGTGKTFTYLKTIFELNKQFKKNKFIIVVPRTAIKLGVVQNIKLTNSYFFNEYKKHLNFIDYPKDGLSKIKNSFINSDDFCVLLTTNSAFNSDKNNINKKAENLFEYGSTWEGINAQKPIIIIDEPHLLKGEETQKGLDKLGNCLQIRFGATFPKDEKDKKDEAHHLSNVVYSLDSISSFNQYLVKRIVVDTVIADSEIGNIKLTETKGKNKSLKISYDKNKLVYSQEIRIGEDIGTKTGLKKYNGIVATKINKDIVFLSDETTLKVIKNYELSDEEIRQMVRQTIKNHFEKEETLFEKNIKTLSLFFIPNIDDFRISETNPNPRIKSIFEKEYLKQRKEIYNKTQNEDYKKYLAKDCNEEGKLQVHEGYFSGDKVSTKDINAGLNKDDLGIDIILNDKEKLLSLGTPLRFIFSVWALQEGWDNPNIFNICKLSSTAQETSRRQQVGRGLRIAVNQNGNRLTYNLLNENEEEFYHINTLDMVVSGREKDFIEGIQNEIQTASFSIVGDLTLGKLREQNLSDKESALLFSILLQNQIIDSNGKRQSSVYEFLKNNKDKLACLDLTEDRYEEILELFNLNKEHISQKNKSIKEVKIRPKKFEEFKELWETINKKSKIVYKDIEEEIIITKVANQFKREEIPPVEIKIFKKQYNTQKDSIETLQENSAGQIDFFKTQKFSDFINFFVKDEKFPFAFILKLLNKIDTQKIKNNPEKAKHRLLEILKETVHSTIISKVSYQFLETIIYPNSLQDPNGKHKDMLLGLGRFDTKTNVPEHLLYDTICWDSGIEEEIQQKDPKEIDKSTVTVFAKLPKISIPTPYKNYNPDFAYLIERENKQKLFLIVETKGYENEDGIPPQEQQKIDYAKKFFDDLQKEIPNVEIKYKMRINKQSLMDILSETKNAN